MTTLKIEKGIPIPLESGRDWQPSAIWHQLELMDSVFIDKPKRLVFSEVEDFVRNSRTDYRFTVRAESTGCRVWRIA